MSWEQQMLRVLAERQYYVELSRVIRPDVLSKDTYATLELYKRYYREYPNVNKILLQPFVEWMTVCVPTNTEEEQNQRVLVQILVAKAFSLDISEEILEDTRIQLCHMSLAEEASQVLMRWRDGEVEESLQEVLDEVLIRHENMVRNTKYMPIRKDLAQILEEQADENGLTLPLDGLNRTISPQKEGDFLCIGAQNNTGKTALAVQIAVHYAKQLPQDAKILYLNNEGIGDHIILRCRQHALDLGRYALEEAFKSGLDVETEYCKAINGDSNKIEVIDVHGINVGQVQSILRKYKPDVVIYDMLDAVHGFGGGGMDVDRYKQLYSWCRAQCAHPDHRHIGVALTQVSHDGHDCEYVPKHALEGSKVAKQSQTDVLIMVGMNEEQPHLRSIWVPRCKRLMRGQTEAGSKFKATFDANVGKYVNGG